MESLDIRYQLIAEDGNVSQNNGDWIETWLIQYQGFTALVDSAERIIELGAGSVDMNEINTSWFELNEHDVDLMSYQYFLDRLTQFVGHVDEMLNIGDGQDVAIRTFDLLWGEGLIDNHPIEVGKMLGVDPSYLDSFVESEIDQYEPGEEPGWMTAYQS